MRDHRPLRVLLISPVASLDPGSGDVTYTEQLLASPPPGVSYTTYDEALTAGDLVEVGARASLRGGTPRQQAQAAALAVWRKAETLLRRTGWAYRERLRHFRVAEGAFDLVHVHVFHSRFLGWHPPIVMSASAPLSWVYRDAFGWSASRTSAADAVDRVMGAAWHATMCGGTRGQAERHVSFSTYYKQWLVKNRRMPPSVVDVVPNYLGPGGRPPDSAVPRSPRHFVMVAKDFEAKGGPDVLRAFARIHADRPDTALTIVGAEPRIHSQPGVTWLGFVEHRRLLGEILPSADVLVHPTRFDGFPYAPMEALAQGIPVIVSDYRAIPEMAADGAGLVVPVGSLETLADAMMTLLDERAHAEASAAARRLFERQFSAATQGPRLRQAYDDALGGR